jgi:hypothetical protein
LSPESVLRKCSSLCTGSKTCTSFTFQPGRRSSSRYLAASVTRVSIKELQQLVHWIQDLHQLHLPARPTVSQQVFRVSLSPESVLRKCSSLCTGSKTCTSFTFQPGRQSASRYSAVSVTRVSTKEVQQLVHWIQDLHQLHLPARPMVSQQVFSCLCHQSQY